MPRRIGPAALIVLSMALPGLSGCGRHQAEVKELVYWTGWSGHEFDVQQGLVDEFNRTHTGVRVRLLSQFGNSGYQKVRIAFAGGATPDIMSTVWADELAGYALRGVLTPLDSYLKSSGRDLDREFTPGVARMLRVRGKVYGLVVTTNTSFVAYNKRIFRESGLDPAHPPQTIAELDAAARKCTVRDGSGRYVRYGFRPGGLGLWAYVFGGRWYDAVTDRPTANDPGNLAALRWMATYRRDYDLRRMQAFQSTFGSDDTASGPFFVGKVAMWTTGEWAESFVKRYAPGMEWGWFPLPCPPGGRPNTTPAGGSVFVIPAACRDKQAAWQFLNWIAGRRPVGTFCREIGNVPPLKAVGQEPAFQQDPLFRFAVGLAGSPNAFGPPGTPIWPTYSREIARVEEKAMLGGQDPKALLDELQFRMLHEQSESRKDLGR